MSSHHFRAGRLKRAAPAPISTHRGENAPPPTHDRSEPMRTATSVAQPAVVPSMPPALDVNGEFSFDKNDFDRVRKLIYARAGISLHEGKPAMV